MTTDQATKRALHFHNSSYPRFGRGIYSEKNPPQSVKDSPYFWWFKFLQLNIDYLVTEKNDGVGVCAEMYKDFGKIADVDFKSWWTSHSHLFAEEQSTFQFIQAKTASDLAPFDSTEAINLVVPLTWSKKGLKKRFSQIIDRYVVDQPKGLNLSTSTAKYRLGTRWVCHAMDAAYRVYTIRHENMDRGAAKTSKMQHKGDESRKFKLSWADVAIQAKISGTSDLKVADVNSHTTDARRVLTILATRYYERAEDYIQCAATSTFPPPRAKKASEASS
jgi:hypothetical protein